MLQIHAFSNRCSDSGCTQCGTEFPFFWKLIFFLTSPNLTPKKINKILSSVTEESVIIGIHLRPLYIIYPPILALGSWATFRWNALFKERKWLRISGKIVFANKLIFKNSAEQHWLSPLFQK